MDCSFFAGAEFLNVTIKRKKLTHMTKTKTICTYLLILLLTAVSVAVPAHAEEQAQATQMPVMAGLTTAAQAAEYLRSLAFGTFREERSEEYDITMNGTADGVDARAMLFYACGGFTDWVAFGERVSSGLCDERLFDHFSYTGTIDGRDGNYRSENVSITILEGRVSDSDYFLADIYIQDISCFVTAFSSEEFMGDSTTVGSMFKTIPGAIVGMNGDYYANNVFGPVVRNGKTYISRVSGYWDIALLDSAGVLTTYPYGKLKKPALKEMDAYQTWVFGPALLDEYGHAKTQFRSKVLPHNPRSVLGYYEPGHYAFLLVDGRSGNCDGITMEELSQFCEELNFTCAYNMDGGQSSVMVAKDGFVNNPFRDGRPVSDILAIREVPEE